MPKVNEWGQPAKPKKGVVPPIRQPPVPQVYQPRGQYTGQVTTTRGPSRVDAPGAAIGLPTGVPSPWGGGILPSILSGTIPAPWPGGGSITAPELTGDLYANRGVQVPSFREQAERRAWEERIHLQWEAYRAIYQQAPRVKAKITKGVPGAKPSKFGPPPLVMGGGGYGGGGYGGGGYGGGGYSTGSSGFGHYLGLVNWRIGF